MTVGLPALQDVEERFVIALASGLSVTEAAQQCSLPVEEAQKWYLSPKIQRGLDQVKKNVVSQRKFTKDMAHDMYMQAFGVSVEPSDMIRATDALVDLHDLKPKPVKGPMVALNIDARNNPGRMETLSTEELAQLAEDGK